MEVRGVWLLDGGKGGGLLDGVKGGGLLDGGEGGGLLDGGEGGGLLDVGEGGGLLDGGKGRGRGRASGWRGQRWWLGGGPSPPLHCPGFEIQLAMLTALSFPGSRIRLTMLPCPPLDPGSSWPPFHR